MTQPTPTPPAPPRRFSLLRRPEVLTVIATFLAAIAASLSVVTAIVQERATFNSILYDKQIKEIGNFMDAVQSATDVSFDELRKIRAGNDPLFADVQSALERTNPAVDKLNQAFFDVKLVVPEEYDGAVDELFDNIKAIHEFLSSEQSELKNHEDASVYNFDNAKTAIDGRLRSEDEFRCRITFFKDCMYSQLRTGHTLNPSDAGRCVPPPNPDKCGKTD